MYIALRRHLHPPAEPPRVHRDRHSSSDLWLRVVHIISQGHAESCAVEQDGGVDEDLRVYLELCTVPAGDHCQQGWKHSGVLPDGNLAIGNTRTRPADVVLIPYVCWIEAHRVTAVHMASRLEQHAPCNLLNTEKQSLGQTFSWLLLR